MLHVTFRELLPHASLLQLAHHEYRQLRDRVGGVEEAAIDCFVVLQSAEADRRADDEPLVGVHVEVRRGAELVLKTRSCASDPEFALRSTMQAAASALRPVAKGVPERKRAWAQQAMAERCA